MPAKLRNIPDLTKYTSFNEYIYDHPERHMSDVSYYKYRRKQFAEQPTTNNTYQNIYSPGISRSIIDTQNCDNTSRENATSNILKKDVNLRQNIENCELNSSDRREIIEKSIWSIKKHAPTQWQCAMTALERLLPEHFAKRDPSNVVQQAIGIRITIGAKEREPEIDVSDASAVTES